MSIKQFWRDFVNDHRTLGNPAASEETRNAAAGRALAVGDMFFLSLMMLVIVISMIFGAITAGDEEEEQPIVQEDK